MARTEVEIVAGAVKIGRHDRDEIATVLAPIRMQDIPQAGLTTTIALLMAISPALLSK
jgi:hypothetical protein